MAMSKAKLKTSDPAEINLTSLMDCIFLLIIFFASIWQAANMEVEAKLTLPEAAQGNPELQQDSDRLIVNIDRDRDIHVSNVRMSREQLSKILAVERAHQHDKEGFGTRPVFIRADENLPFGEVQEVMKVCQKNRLWKLSLRTIKPQDDAGKKGAP